MAFGEATASFPAIDSISPGPRPGVVDRTP